MDFTTTKNKFTAYIKAVIQNSSIDYKRKLLRRLENEISVADYANLSKELLSDDNGSFLLENED